MKTIDAKDIKYRVMKEDERDFSGLRIIGTLEGTSYDLPKNEKRLNLGPLDISGSICDYMEFKNLNLSDVKAVNTSFRGANFESVGFDGAEFHNANFWGANFNYFGISNTNGNSVDFGNINARGLTIENSTMDMCSLYGSRISGLGVYKSSFRDSEFYNANIRGSSLTNSDLSNANLECAVMESVNITGSNFTGAHGGGIKSHNFKIRKLRIKHKGDFRDFKKYNGLLLKWVGGDYQGEDYCEIFDLVDTEHNILLREKIEYDEKSDLFRKAKINLEEIIRSLNLEGVSIFSYMTDGWQHATSIDSGLDLVCKIETYLTTGNDVIGTAAILKECIKEYATNSCLTKALCFAIEVQCIDLNALSPNDLEEIATLLRDAIKINVKNDKVKSSNKRLDITYLKSLLGKN